MNKFIFVLFSCFILVICFIVYAESTGELKKVVVNEHVEKEKDETIVTEFLDEVDTTIEKLNALKQTNDYQSTDLFSYMMKEVEVVTPPNEELQQYIYGQSKIDGNHIKIVADQGDQGYQSGKLESIVGFKYGTFTFKIKNVVGNGLFPAIWLLPTHQDGYPEVDIYEHIGNEPNYVYGVIHTFVDEIYDKESFRYYVPSYAIPDEYYLTFTWTKEKLSWYINDVLVLEVTEKVPQEPMYLIMNFAVGGIWPKAPTPDVTFPATFEFDIVDFQVDEIHKR